MAETTDKATNRQKKVLRFYGLPHIDELSVGEASWEITHLWASPEIVERWDKYVYLTGDVDDDSAELRPFNEAELSRVVLPADWDRQAEVRGHREALAASLLENASPFNEPPPPVYFEGKVFVLTGRFEHGTRDQCEMDTRNRGGHVVGVVLVGVDYLVVGAKGSSQWKHGAYGTKIEAGVLERRARRKLAIIAEGHWCAHLAASPRVSTE